MARDSFLQSCLQPRSLDGLWTYAVPVVFCSWWDSLGGPWTWCVAASPGAVDGPCHQHPPLPAVARPGRAV